RRPTAWTRSGATGTSKPYRLAGSASRPRSRGSSPSLPRTSRRTAPAASSWPMAGSCPGQATDARRRSTARNRLKRGRSRNMGHPLTLDGKTAIVTGAANGLGRAEAIALSAAGARVVLNDLPGHAVQSVADEIMAAGGQAVVSAGDVGESLTGEAM